MNNPQVIVTGASRGIGAAIASELDRHGFAIAGLSRSGGVPVGYGISCDVCKEDSIDQAIAKISAKGPIVGVVNAAGMHSDHPSATLKLADFEQMMRLNASSVLMVSQKAYPHLKQSQDALIVNIGSFLDKIAVPKSLAYCASKAAVGAITRCLAAEWAKDKISVLNIAPGYVETDLNRDFLAKEKVRQWLASRIPVGRVCQPEEVARFVGALFASRTGFLTGETIYFDGAQGINL